MTDHTVTIIIAVISALGGGGIGAAVIGWIANREKIKADAYATIAEVYEKRLTALTERVTCLEAKDEAKTIRIDELKREIEEREDMVEALQRENVELKAENEELKGKVAVLERQVAELKAELKKLTEGRDG